MGRAEPRPFSTMLVATVLASGAPPLLAQTFNYTEALQKSLFFYEAQISGPKPSWSRVTWRGDSAMQDGADVGRNLTGGWFDAGDHVKFGFAMASSATMLAWSGVEYRDSFAAEGQLPHLLNNLRFVNDYFIRAHSAPNELWGQVGTGGSDHSFWGSAEVMHLRTTRPSARITLSCGGSDLAAETAAAMAASSIVFRPTDPAYADTLLVHARQLFDFAEATHPSFYVDCIPDAAGFYNSHFGNPNDEMTWAAIWLHRATDDPAFLARARELYPTMCKETGTSTPCFTWSQSWNDKHFGVYVLMAQVTGEPAFRVDVQRWLDYWTVGAGRTSRTTPGGLMFVDGFGPIRYATNAAFLALVYSDLIGPSDPLFPRYHDFAKRQVDYALGANPRSSSYVVGFGNNPPRNPHHRTAHGTWNNSPSAEPNPSRHTLYGGLVGGPNSNDAWADDRSDFQRTEVATDFNAGFTGALARLAQEFGGNPLPDFPVAETPDDEIFIDAQINVQGQNFTEIRALLTNESAWPSRILSQGTFRYYFTLEPGVTPAQVTLQGNFNQCGSGNLTGPFLFSGNTYFVTVSCVGTNIYPGGQDVFRREVQFRIAVPANVPGNWDTSNDYSFQGLTTGSFTRTSRIVVFDNGVRIWGDEPPTSSGFTLSATPSSVTVGQGSTAASTIGISRTGGFAGAVTVAATGLPTGVTATFSVNPVTGASSVVTFAAAAGTTAGTFPVTITGTASGQASQSTTILLTVAPGMGFTLSATPPSVSVIRGGTAASTINVARTGGFAGAVTLAATGLPTGVTATFSANPATGATSTITFTAAATATLGPATVTVTGTATGVPNQSTSISLTVNPAAGFTLSATPPSVTVNQGSTAASTINVARTGGFAGAVTLAATGLPTGVTATFSANPATGATSTLTFTAAATATPGPATVTVTGTATGVPNQTTSISLTVSPTGGVVTPTPLVNSNSPFFNEEALRIDNTATLTAVSITVVLQRTTGVSFSGQYNTVGGQFTQTNSSTAAAITYQWTLAAGQILGPGTNRLFAAQASGSGTTHPTAGDTWSLTYTSGGQTVTQSGTFGGTSQPGFTLSAAPPSVTVVQGSTATSTINITRTGGFAGGVTLAATGLPTGVTGTFSANPATGATSTLTFTAAANATLGPATVTVTGTATGVPNQSTSISLTVNPAAGFTLSATPPTVTVNQGSNAASTINVARTGGFAGAVTLAATGLPTGVTATFSVNPATGATSTLTFAAAATATLGPATVTVTGTATGVPNQTTSISLTVNPAAGFTLSATPPSVTVNQGSNAASTINLARTGGFAGAVTLAATGLPTGVTATFSANPATGATSTITFTAAATATLGPATVTVTGTATGVPNQTTSISLTVNPAAGFTLSATPPSVTVNQGSNAASTINLARTGGFAGAVTLAATGLPTGVTATFSANPATGATSTITFTAAATATLGPATVTVTGTATGVPNQSTSISLTVNPAAGFTLSATPPSVTVNQGSTAASTITVARTGGFAGAVTLAATGLPTGVTAAFSANPATGATSTLTFTAAATATPGPATVTVTGTATGVPNQTTSISLTVSPTGGVVTPTPLVNSNSPFFNEEALRIDNTATLTAVSITVVLQRTTGVSFSGQYNTVGGQFTQTNSSTAAAITYQWTLAAGQTLGPGTNRLFAAQASGSGTTHPTAGDTWSLTYTSGGQTVTQSGTFGGTSQPGFTLSTTPPTVGVDRGSTATSTINITRTGGFAGGVTLAATGLPTGVTAAFSANPATGATSTLTFTAAANATLGPATVTVTGTATGIPNQTTSIALTVNPAAGFTLSAVPPSVTVDQGSTAATAIRIARAGSFTSAVTLAASGLPTGVTATFSVNPATGATSTLTFTAAATASLGPATVTVTGNANGVPSQTTSIALTVNPPLTVNAYTQRFLDMWGDLHGNNGYFHPSNIPYHSVETLMVEAPDHGHETTSEAFSFWAWLEVMYGHVTGNWTPLQQMFDSMEANIIPTPADQPTNSFYNPGDPADYAPEFDLPSGYPAPIDANLDTGSDPIGAGLQSTYGTPNVYGMHWIIDVDNFYGYGRRGDGVSQPSYMNTFQRGPQESTWETVPHPSWEDFLSGGSSSAGFLPLFITGPTPAQQWRYTDAPDADARLIQAMYWANQFAPGNPTVTSLSAKAARMGDYLRYAFFDKYFKTMGCASPQCPAGTGYNAAHYLLSWYYAWGGPIPPQGGWSFRIGSSHNHFGYQNPMAAHALVNTPALRPQAPNAVADWTTSLDRQLEFYRWLQSANGAIAGGATNSLGGRYLAPPAGTATFYGMFFQENPVYLDPGSNTWFGFQAWSVERVAEYYHETGNAEAKLVLDKWVPWAMANTRLPADGTFEVPSTLAWNGQPSLNWNATTQNWNAGDATYNAGLTVTVTEWGTDLGVTAALAKTLIYYSAGTRRWATQHVESQAMAKELLDRMWSLDRDAIGVSVPEVRRDYNRFDDPIFVPSSFSGVMANGDPIDSSSTFISIRSAYRNDPDWPLVQSYLDGGPAPTLRYHRFWAQVDVALANAEYGRLFP